MSAAPAGGNVVITVSLHHFRGTGACRIEAPVAVSLLTARGTTSLLKVRGNPIRGSLGPTLAPEVTATAQFRWSNWCDAGGTYTVNGAGPFGGGVLVRTPPPRCTGRQHPSVLARA